MSEEPKAPCGGGGVGLTKWSSRNRGREMRHSRSTVGILRITEGHGSEDGRFGHVEDGFRAHDITSTSGKSLRNYGL